MRKYFTALLVVGILAIFVIVLRQNYMQFNSIVSIRNSRWEKVHIQVRKGYQNDPWHNKLIFDQYLIKGQCRTFTFDNGDDILYRRDLDPNHRDGVHFTNWTYANCGEESICDVTDP